MDLCHCRQIASPVGELGILTDAAGRLLEIVFLADRVLITNAFRRLRPDEDLEVDAAGDGPTAAAAAQLAEYFAGRRRVFELELRLRGTAFQRQVWGALLGIPYGATWSYGEVAEHIGRPGIGRAVGSANGRNPIPIVVPCHRVIGASGSLSGYGGGVARKRYLLELEGWQGGRAASS